MGVDYRLRSWSQPFFRVLPKPLSRNGFAKSKEPVKSTLTVGKPNLHSANSWRPNGLRGEIGRSAAPGREEIFFGRPARRRKNLRLCRFGAFENPQCTWVPHARVMDPTTRPERRVGLHAPDRLLAPAGTRIGSSKVSPVHEHRRGFVRPQGGRTVGIYHGSPPNASA